MTPLEQARATLDGVEPDGFIYAYQGQEMALSRTMQPAGIPPSLYWQQPLYSRETVESLLESQRAEYEERMAECRKEALLEAIAVVEANILPRLILDELRRMAADASSTLEGEKG